MALFACCVFPLLKSNSDPSLPYSLFSSKKGVNLGFQKLKTRRRLHRGTRTKVVDFTMFSENPVIRDLIASALSAGISLSMLRLWEETTKRGVFDQLYIEVDALSKLEERGVVVRFVIGRSPNRGDSLDRNINEENRATKDFLILESHEEAQEELPKKAKHFFSSAIQTWDAEFYVKVDDNIDVDLDGLIELLQNRRGQDSSYIGCMKSGEVVSEEGRAWYEPEWWKFGDEKSYFRHAAGSVLVLSKNLAQYININSASLKSYAHEDISIGSWMMGLQTTFTDDSRLCCSTSGQDKVCSLA